MPIETSIDEIRSRLLALLPPSSWQAGNTNTTSQRKMSVMSSKRHYASMPSLSSASSSNTLSPSASTTSNHYNSSLMARMHSVGSTAVKTFRGSTRHEAEYAIPATLPLLICDGADFKNQDLAIAMSDAWSRFDERATAMVRQLPAVPLKRRKATSTLCTPAKIVHNNNGLPVTEGRIGYKQIRGEVVEDSVQRNGEWIVLRHVETLDGENINTFSPQAYFSPRDQRLFPTIEDAINHDAVEISGGKHGPIVMTLCDGCQKGANVAHVAITASATAHELMNNKIGGCKTLRQIAKHLFDAVKYAQESIGRLGTCRDTTYLQMAVIGNKVVGLSIGDCKAFVFRRSEFIEGRWTCKDLTENSRDSADIANPGGFLKSSNYPETPPDTTCMKLFYDELLVGDVLVVCTDGIYDNFDPRNQGLQPRDVSIDSESWETVDTKDPGVVQKIEKAVREGLSEAVCGASDGANLSRMITEQVMKLTEEQLRERLLHGSCDRWQKMGGKPDDATLIYVDYILEDAG